MGLFDSWSGFAESIVDGAEDLGSWVSSNIGEVVGIATGINDLLNPTKVQDGKAGSNATANSGWAAPSWLAQPSAADAAKVSDSEGSIVGTLMLFTAALVVVVLIAKRA